MAETGIIRLDPRAQEFRPRSTNFLPFCSSTPISPNPAALPIFHPFLPPTEQTLLDAFPASTTGSAPLPFLGPPLPPPLPPPQNGNFHLTTPPQPHPQAPSRAVVLSLVTGDMTETSVRRELEVFGEVRAVEMEWVVDGVVTVHFYDLRHAKRAVREIREQHDRAVAQRQYGYSHNHPFLRGRFSGVKRLFGGNPVWAQFVIPVASCIPEGQNQGTIVIFNLEPSVTADELRRTFEAFGLVKELRDTPFKKHQRFVEFFDVRDASRALREMNGKDINGRSVMIEFSRPGGFSRKSLLVSNQNFAGAGGYPIPTQHNSKPLPSRTNAFSLEDSLCNLSLEDDAKKKKKLCVMNQHQQQRHHHHQQQQLQQLKGKTWKGKRHMGKSDSRFVITANDDSMEEPRSYVDSRTTVMIRNIPNKYSQQLLLSMLDNHCIHTNEQISGEDCAASGGEQPFSSYDFVYLPIDFNNKCNVGYGFVNMTTPEAARRLHKAFHRRHWEVFNSRKICEVTYARIQGLEALKDHFKNSKFPSETDLFLPVVFSPPRDGRTLTEPSPVVGRTVLLHLDSEGGDPGENSSSDGEDYLSSGVECSSSRSRSHSHSLSRQSSNVGGVEDDSNDSFRIE